MTILVLVLIALAGVFAILWRSESRAKREAHKVVVSLAEQLKAERISRQQAEKGLDAAHECYVEEKALREKLETEILRLQKIPLTQPKEKVDTSTIRAKSAADVRRLTETAWGMQPEIGDNDGA